MPNLSQTKKICIESYLGGGEYSVTYLTANNEHIHTIPLFDFDIDYVLDNTDYKLIYSSGAQGLFAANMRAAHKRSLEKFY